MVYTMKRHSMKTILVALFAAILTSCGGTGSQVTALEAYVISQQLIEPQLPHPEKAEFKTGNYVSEEVGENEWIIKSEVTTPNADGVMMTVDWQTLVQYNGGDWKDKSNWTLKKFSW